MSSRLEDLRRVLSTRHTFYYRFPACVLLNIGEAKVLIDPGQTFTAEEAEVIEELDVIAVTHEHTDHYSRDIVVDLARKTGAAVVTNKTVFKDLRRLVADERMVRLKAGESVDLDGLRVHALRSVHPGLHPLVLLFETDDLAVFHGSDSGFSNAFEAFSPVDVAFVPVGGPSPTASVNDALRMVRIMSASVAVPIHGYPEEVTLFKERAKVALSSVKVVIPEDGRCHELPL